MGELISAGLRYTVSFPDKRVLPSYSMVSHDGTLSWKAGSILPAYIFPDIIVTYAGSSINFVRWPSQNIIIIIIINYYDRDSGTGVFNLHAFSAPLVQDYFGDHRHSSVSQQTWIKVRETCLDNVAVQYLLKLMSRIPQNTLFSSIGGPPAWTTVHVLYMTGHSLGWQSFKLVTR